MSRPFVFVGLPTLLMALVLSAGGVAIVYEKQQRADDIKAAEAVAGAYFVEALEFRQEIYDALRASKKKDAASLRMVLRSHWDNPPEVGAAPVYGMDESDTYAGAVADRRELLEPYERLDALLTEAIRTREFVSAATRVLEVDPSTYIDYFDVEDGGQIRNEAIPRLRSDLATFNAVKVPKGGKKAAAEVNSAVGYVLEQLAVLASRTDAQESYSFSYSDQYSKARQAVADVVTDSDGDVTEMLDQLEGDLED